MRIAFADNKLRDRLSDARAMARAYGDRAKRLRMRLDVLRAAERLADVPAGPPDRRHELTANWRGHFAVHITGNWRLIFRPDHDPAPTREDGGIDLGAVTAIVIVAIEDYH